MEIDIPNSVSTVDDMARKKRHVLTVAEAAKKGMRMGAGCRKRVCYREATGKGVEGYPRKSCLEKGKKKEGKKKKCLHGRKKSGACKKKPGRSKAKK